MSHPPFAEHFESTFNAIVFPTQALAVQAAELDGPHHHAGVQVLYWLRSKHPQTRPGAMRACAQWCGAGSIDDAPALVDRMVTDGFLWEIGVPTKRLVVSPKGIDLLSRLHPAFEDADLPARLAIWSASWSASEAEVERHLRSIAARQRGYTAT